MSALAFAALALLLAGPVPAALARASWPLRAPRATVVLWQAIALAAVLSAFSAGLAVVASLFDPGPDGHAAVSTTGWPQVLTGVVVLAATTLIGIRLVTAIAQVAIGTRRRRAHHRTMVDLLGECRHDMNDLRVLRVAEPLAYCLPGIRRRVVVSAGAIQTLSESELAAILRHERAHLGARHDLVLEAFIAVHTAFPRFVRSGSALGAVALLVELLADDAAVKATGRGPLARALVACASARTPAGAMAAGGPSAVIRVQRLAGRPNSWAIAVATYVAAAAVLTLPTVAVAVPWLTELHRLFLAH
ncbi:MAG: M56 family metallopeptidase [Mycobacterium sp.]|nr:M56 family metallopeptidase [Mycobacterium sp.]